MLVVQASLYSSRPIYCMSGSSPLSSVEASRVCGNPQRISDELRCAGLACGRVVGCEDGWSGSAMAAR